MISRNRSVKIRLHKQIVLPFSALSILLVLFLSQTSVPEPVKARVEKSEGCCGGHEGDNKPHLLAGSYYTVKNNLSARLLLNNKGPSPIEVRPTLFSMKGERFEPPTVVVEGNSYQFIDLADWAAIAGPGFEDGSIQLFHRGKDLVLGAQIYLADNAHSLSFDEKLNEPATSTASRLAGVWWLPSPKGAVTVVVSNTTDAAISVTAKISGNSPQREESTTVDLQAHETKTLDVCELLKSPSAAMPAYGAISVEHNGIPGGLLARAFAYDEALGYSLPIQFSDTKGGKSTSLQGTGLRVGNVKGETLSPKVVAHNAGEVETTLSGRVQYTTTDGTNGEIYLPAIQLSIGETDLIDIEHSLKASGLHNNDVVAAGLEFDYPGKPGSVVTSAFSVSRNGNQVFRVPLWDIVAQRSATGGYPWYIEGDSSTIVYIKNVTDEPRQYSLQLRYDGGVYAVGLKTIRPHETVTFDIRGLRDQQVPDESGKTLPPNAASGQINWSMRGPQNQVLIGRSEQADLTRGVSSNYACMNCCPDSFSGGWVDPGGVDSLSGDIMQFTSFEQTTNCYGSSNAPYTMWAGWDSTDWNVLGFCGGPGEGTAELPGLANAQARWLAYEWGSFESGNPNECYERPIDVLAEAICQVLLAADRLQVVSDTGQVALTACPSIITRQIVYQVLDTNGAAINRIIRVREQFQNQTTNTCGNGQPNPSSCGPTNSAGQIADTLSITCGGQSGAQSNPSCGFTQTQTISTCAPHRITELSFASHSIKANQVLVNNTTQFQPGIILPK